MDFERGSEFITKEEPVNKESSYSEEEQAKVIEGSTVDIKQAGNKRKPLPSALSRKEKIVAVYKRNLEKILQLVETISQISGKNYRQEEQIMEEIKSLRHVQEELLNALLLEGKGQLTEKSISQEAWNLIQ